MTALLRPAVESDLNEVVRIERGCFADPWSEESFRRLLAVEPAIFQVAAFPPDSRIGGYAIAFAIGEDGEVLNVAVEPPFRGKGLAGQMLDALLIGKFVIMYSGNHSPSNPLTTILDAVVQLKDDSNLRFLFVGGGTGKKEVEQYIRDQKIDCRSRFEQRDCVGTAARSQHLVPSRFQDHTI